MIQKHESSWPNYICRTLHPQGSPMASQGKNLPEVQETQEM